MELYHTAVHFLVTLIFLIFLTEELYQQLSAYRKSFVKDSIYLIITVLSFSCKSPSGLSCLTCRDHKKRNNCYSQKSQYPVLLEHGNKRKDKRYGIGQYTLKGIRYYRFNSIDITGHSCYDIALVTGCKKSLGHLLQMPEHLISHIKCNVLRYPRINIAFSNSDHICAEGYTQ